MVTCGRTVSKGWIETAKGERREENYSRAYRGDNRRTETARLSIGEPLFHASSLAMHFATRFFTLLMTFGSFLSSLWFQLSPLCGYERTNFREIRESCMSRRIENILREMFYVNIYYFLIPSNTFEFRYLKSSYEIFIITANYNGFFVINDPRILFALLFILSIFLF